MNILIVTENFLVGGLERSIINQCEYLEKNGHNVYFALRNYKDLDFFKNRHVLILPEKMFDSSEVLIDFIEKNNINIIHAHPFNTVLCSIFASQVTQIPMVYSVHGLGSLNYTHRIEDDVILRYFIGEVQPNILSVSKYYCKFLKEAYFNENTHYLPNSINFDLIPKDSVECEKGIGVFVGRFSEDNVASLKLLFLKRKIYNLEKVVIYGYGEKLEELKELVNSSNGFFEYKGICKNPLETIRKYEVVVGSGQQVMEGIASKKKVILIGYGKVSGYLNFELYNKIKFNNFVNRFISKDENKEFSINDLELIYEDFFQNFNSFLVNKKYLDILLNAEFINNDYLTEIYQLRNTDSLINLCKKKILPNTLNPFILNILKW